MLTAESTQLMPEPNSASNKEAGDSSSAPMMNSAEEDVMKQDMDNAAEQPVTPKQDGKKPSRLASTPSSRVAKKKVPWRGKNIMILLPQDDRRGRPGTSSMPLSPGETRRMYDSWKELGYNTDGFDLMVENSELSCTDDSKSRPSWPSAEDMARERAQGRFQVILPDLNAWKNYVNELQEAKLRALGVSFSDNEPQAATSPHRMEPSRRPSAQHATLPFSPPMPPSSVSSNQAVSAFPPFPGQYIPASQSPGLPSGASPITYSSVPAKFNPNQSISIPAGSPQFPMASQQPGQGWTNQAGLQGVGRTESPSLVNLNGMLSPQSPYGLDRLQQTMSPVFNMHDMQQPPMQYLPQQMASAVSPRLPEVVEEDTSESQGPFKAPDAAQRNRDSLQAEIDEAEYHLEEQLRNQFEHEDYNPQLHSEGSGLHTESVNPVHDAYPPSHDSMAARFAEDSCRPLVLHHPQPHSREHSVSQSFFRDHNEGAEGMSHDDMGRLGSLSEAAESGKTVDEVQEIETNPSNLGTPVPNFDVEAVLQPHQKTVSNASNPWQDSASATSSSHPMSHGSKLSYSKLNVEAPEFKFNPTSSIATGLFNFGRGSSQPTAFQAGNTFGVNPPHGSSASTKFHATAPSFSPGQSEFSFSSTGPKFRPDAPAFQPLSGSLFSPVGSGSESASNRNSIFSNIDLTVSSIVKPPKESKAVPIVNPSNDSSTRSIERRLSVDEMQEGPDGRLADDTRVKRARSLGPEAHKSSLYVGQSNVADEASSADDASTFGGDNVPPFDTSMSSVPTSADALEGRANAGTVSEAYPTGNDGQNWNPFNFQPTFETQVFQEAHRLNDDGFIMPNPARSSSEEPGASKRKVNEPEETVNSSRQSTPFAGRPVAVAKGLGSSRFAPSPKKPEGLAASHFARVSSSSAGTSNDKPAEDDVLDSVETSGPFTQDLIDVGHVCEPAFEESVMQHFRDHTPDDSIIKSVEEAAPSSGRLIDVDEDREPTFEEIDAVMQQLKNDPTMGVNKTFSSPSWRRLVPVETQAPAEQSQLLINVESPGEAAQASSKESSKGSLIDDSNSHPRQDKDAGETGALLTTELEDPFVDPSGRSSELDNEFDEADAASDVVSDWEATFTEDEHSKLGNRAQFFDGRVNEVLGSLLDSRLGPLEKTISSIQLALASKSRRAPSSRREMRSISEDIRESDADDEDEEPIPRRSMSPRRDRRLDQIRLAVMEALANQQSKQQSETDAGGRGGLGDFSTMLQTLDGIKEQFSSAMQARAESSDKSIGEPVISEIHDELQKKMEALQGKIEEAEQRLELEQGRVEKEISERRNAEDAAAELNRKLQAAETRVEVEIINRSVFDQRVADLEERLRQQEDRTEEEVKGRRTAEDRLSEVQRLLRISSEEENRLRDKMEDKEQQIKTLEQESGKTAVRVSLLEAAQSNAAQLQSDMTNTINALEADLRTVRQDNNHWRTEAERCDEVAHRKTGELAHVAEENKHLQKSLSTLASQLEENERLREAWRSKFMSLQEDMARAARDVEQEKAQRIKEYQTMLARQEVLDARLHAEAKTRERLEVEMERLQDNERTGMRAVNECKRLEVLLGEMRGHNDKLQLKALHYQREFDEARESGAVEVKRTRMAMQLEVDAANNQVNMIRQELEDQNSKLRAELDSVKLEADTAKAQSEMLLEEAQTTKAAEIDAVKRAHQNELEDMQTRYECRINNATEEAQKTEQNLLDRLSLSSSKIEHLQDRIVHLEDKVEVAKEAAAAAAQAAKSAGVETSVDAAGGVTQPAREQVSSQGRQEELPSKISPQALRESIMVLQEQLQAREQRIEELEQLMTKMDPDAASKISKRDDEIGWLRELLDVRQGDLGELIASLSADHFDREAVRDTAIRLRANVEMMEQERSRGKNGGSVINLPNVAQSIQAATPRVAQTIGPLAAAWVNWRKSNQQQPPRRSMTGGAPKPSTESSWTPSKTAASHTYHDSITGGLLTPPTSGLRHMASLDMVAQPTAFANTGRRYTPQGAATQHARQESRAAHHSQQHPSEQHPSEQEHGTSVFSAFSTQHRGQQQPLTPPMMGPTGYDSDAQPGDFDDHDFFQDD